MTKAQSMISVAQMMQMDDFVRGAKALMELQAKFNPHRWAPNDQRTWYTIC